MHKLFSSFFKLIFGKVRMPNYTAGKWTGRLPWVSFIIPARNEEKSIGTCIKSIIDDGYPKTEIVVIDDLSTDSTRDIVRDLRKKYSQVDIHLLVNKQRGGPSPNRNKGVRKSKGEFIIMFDAHSVITTKNFVKTYLNYFSDDNVGAVAGGKEWTPKHYQDQVLYYAGGLRPWREMGFQFLDNPNAGYRRSAFEKMGMIDSSIVWGSDLDSTFKILELGYLLPVARDAAIRVDHAHTPNRKIDFIRKPFLYGTMFLILIRKHAKLLWKRRVDVHIVFWGLVNLISLPLLFSSLWYIPLLTVLLARLHSIAFALYNRMPLKYLPGVPFFLTISEMAYALGFLYGSVRLLLGLQTFSYKK